MSTKYPEIYVSLTGTGGELARERLQVADIEDVTDAVVHVIRREKWILAPGDTIKVEAAATSKVPAQSA